MFGMPSNIKNPHIISLSAHTFWLQTYIYLTFIAIDKRRVVSKDCGRL